MGVNSSLIQRLKCLGIVVILTIACLFSLSGNALACSDHHGLGPSPDRPIVRQGIPLSNIPERVEIALNKGIEAAQRQRYKPAIGQFTKVIQADPQHDEAYWRRAEAYSQLKQYDLAVADFDAAIAINSTYNYLYEQRGEAKVQLGDLTGALADFDFAIAQYPETALNYWSRGLVYVRLGDYDRALADLNQVLKQNPNDSNAYAQRGLIYALRGDRETAAQDYAMADRMSDPQNWIVRELLVARHH
jgi:tetratricopeptide (TPR) repeat protein